MADRQFGDLDEPERLTEEGTTSAALLPETWFQYRPPAAGAETFDGQGRRVIDNGVGSEPPGRRDGDTCGRSTWSARRGRALSGDRPFGRADYPAEDLLAVYLKRWGIERVFQKITEVFHLERLLEHAEATIFQAAFV